MNLICINCNCGLIEDTDKLLCENCHAEYKKKKGIFSFTDINCLFEGRFKGKIELSKYKYRFWYKIYQYLNLSQRRQWFLEKHLDKLIINKTILDCGCGGGGNSPIIKNYASKIIGIDVSLDSLLNAKEYYDEVYHSALEKLPFESNSFDIVITTDVLGHTDLKTKNRVYSEMCRVLKIGGTMIHAAIETDSKSPWLRFSKKYPELYKNIHIDKWGHIGMEYPSDILRRFEILNMKRIDYVQMNSLVLSPHVILSWFDNKYKYKSILVKALVDFNNKVTQYRMFEKILDTFLLGLFDRIINCFIPVDWATGLLVALRKLK